MLAFASTLSLFKTDCSYRYLLPLVPIMDGSFQACSMAVEDVFGPTVDSSCHHGFDFTLLFEESILTILPLGIARKFLLLKLIY